MTDEKSILEQFAAGNHTAFRELFMRYHLKVYYFVLGLVKSENLSQKSNCENSRRPAAFTAVMIQPGDLSSF